MGRKKNSDKTEEVKPEEEQTPKAYDFFSRKKDRGFTAMTKEASMMADENKKTPKLPEKISRAIHKIRDDK